MLAGPLGKSLYRQVLDARECCAGSHIKNQETLLGKVNNAIEFARMADAQTPIIEKLLQAKVEINKSLGPSNITDEHRIAADNILCDLLNHELAQYE